LTNLEPNSLLAVAVLQTGQVLLEMLAFVIMHGAAKSHLGAVMLRTGAVDFPGTALFEHNGGDETGFR
jgi:hypothetical protein